MWEAKESAIVLATINDEKNTLELEGKGESTVTLKPRGVYYEGLFLKILYNKLEKLLDNTQDINIFLTGTITKLCCYPDSILHSYLINPQLSIHTHVRTLYKILAQVAASAHSIISNFDDYTEKLKQIKEAGTDPTDSDTKLLNNLIIHVEFRKELVSFVETTQLLFDNETLNP